MIDEPFSAVYYLGPERVSDRFGLAEPQVTAATVVGEMTAAPARTFVKDMVHHVPPGRRPEVARLGRHTILTRDPARAIPSFAKVWPDVTWEECGYEALAAFADHLEATGQRFDVIDAADLMADPESVLSAWCGRHGLDFDRTTLQWAPGPVPQWTRWLEFHANAVASTGLSPRPAGPPPTVDDPTIAAMVERATPLHDELIERAAS